MTGDGRDPREIPELRELDLGILRDIELAIRAPKRKRAEVPDDHPDLKLLNRPIPRREP